MDIQFDTEEIRTLCLNQSVAERRFGKEEAEQLRNRIADLRATETILELPVGLTSEIGGENGRVRFVTVGSGRELVMTANNKQVPVAEDGNVNWLMVDRIKILKIREIAVA